MSQRAPWGVHPVVQLVDQELLALLSFFPFHDLGLQALVGPFAVVDVLHQAVDADNLAIDDMGAAHDPHPAPFAVAPHPVVHVIGGLLHVSPMGGLAHLLDVVGMNHTAPQSLPRHPL
jgi:hypothetical protein